MVLRIDPELPVVWRSPSSVQIGVDPALAVLEGVTDGDARLLAALAAGVSPSGFDMLARSAGVGAAAAERLLDDVRPALAGDPAVPHGFTVGVLGDSVLARTIAGLLDEAGARAEPDAASLVVLVADWVVAPIDHFSWLSRDVPHVAVVTGERAVTVGPFVEPGLGPCLYCVHLARTDADPAWPAIATQLMGRQARDLGRLATAEVAAFALRRLQARRSDGPGAPMSWRIDDRGGVSVSRWAPHPDCRCAAPAGTDWAAAPTNAPLDATRTVTAGAAHA